ncbi:NAD-dependent epimerase/dehydratase family protein [Halioglobus maricola]|nr:NAD-dependent epimerase/dehydratase family protein [Halioglobus maricola]
MPRKNRVVAVTGATGFVGRHFVERILQETGISVRCVVRDSSDVAGLEHLDDDIEVVHADVTRPDTLEDAFADVWGVVNLAGYREFWSKRREHFYDVNQVGAGNVFRACLARGVEKVVQVSTPLAFGRPDEQPFDEMSAPGAHPSDYARSKFLGDEEGWCLHQEEDLPLTVVHLAAVIGAGDDKATMEVKRAVDGKLPALVGADTTYTYLYVRDAADAIARALLNPDTVGQRYLIGNQRATTREYFSIIGRIAGVPVPSRNIPESWLMPVARCMEAASRVTGIRPVVPLDVLKTTAAGSLLFDASRSVDELGMTYTSLSTALSESVEEIRSAA